MNRPMTRRTLNTHSRADLECARETFLKVEPSARIRPATIRPSLPPPAGALKTTMIATMMAAAQTNTMAMIDDPTYNKLARTTNINQQPQNLKHITAARACASRSSVLKSSDLSSDLGSDLRSDLRSDLSSDLSFEHARAAIARPSSKRE